MQESKASLLLHSVSPKTSFICLKKQNVLHVDEKISGGSWEGFDCLLNGTDQARRLEEQRFLLPLNISDREKEKFIKNKHELQSSMC